ncbi:MAG TPA: enoyl-CoA hydratase-related protein [Puia sp.]|jgi:2-(1,2-epoxy-1,2-dihydrophenyl)acetyl-CoA isomerase
MPEILFEIRDHVARLSLNRPEKLNAFNRSMALELQDQLLACDENDSVRAVLLTGEGRAFCSGQDLSEFPPDRLPDFENVIDEYYNPVIRLLKTVRKPVLCAVNGIAAGAGANIALACDIVVAVSTSHFVQAFSKIGLIPDCAGTFFLPRLVGLQKATALMMLGDKISAAEAERMGMIYACFEETDFYEKTDQIALALAKLPTTALILTRKLLLESSGNNLEEQLDLEKKFQQKAGHTRDFSEGVTAFLQKRTPQFTGK